MISKIELKFLKIIWCWNVYVFNVGFIIITFKLLLIKNNLFPFKISISIYLFYIFPWIFIILFHFFSNKNCQVQKNWNKKNMLVVVGEGVIQLFKLKISPN